MGVLRKFVKSCTSGSKNSASPLGEKPDSDSKKDHLPAMEQSEISQL
jgi:hypothetical protein